MAWPGLVCVCMCVSLRLPSVKLQSGESAKEKKTTMLLLLMMMTAAVAALVLPSSSFFDHVSAMSSSRTHFFFFLCSAIYTRTHTQRERLSHTHSYAHWFALALFAENFLQRFGLKFFCVFTTEFSPYNLLLSVTLPPSTRSIPPYFVVLSFICLQHCRVPKAL